MQRTQLALFILFLLMSSLMVAQVDEMGASDNLEQKIQNPIADLISLPFQNNIDFGIGPDNRTRNTLNIQPVVPFKVSDNFNLISRTIIPVISQPIGASDSEFGLGDVNLSLFLTSSQPKKTIIGYGLALGLPTATDPALGTGKWSAGPSLIFLVQPQGLTAGVLLQNTWSYAGVSDRPDVNLFYSQVFIVKNLPKGWYVNSAPIITANWEASSGNQWTVPIGAGAGKLFRAGKLPINAQLGYYYNVVTPDFGPESQLRIQVVLLFPK